MAGRRYGGHVRARGPDTFELRLYIGTVTDANGKKRKKYHTETFHGTNRDAVARMAQLVTDYTKGVLIDPTKMTVGEYFDYWLSHASRNRSWKPNTLRNKRDAIAHIKREKGAARLQDVKPLDIQNMYAKIKERIEEAGGVGNAALLLVHVVCCQGFRQAVEWKLIQANPMEGVVRPQYKKRQRISWTPGQQQKFLAVASKYKYYAAYYLMLHCGLRVGETAGLRWSDVGRDSVRVRYTARRQGRQLNEGTPKTVRSERAVPIDQSTLDVLLEYKAEQEQEKTEAGGRWLDQEGRVFTTALGRPAGYDVLRMGMVRICKQADIPYGSPHHLRHVFGDNLAGAGVDARTGSELMGHASSAFFLDNYTHPNDERLREGVLKASRYSRNGNSNGVAEQ